MQYTSDRDRSAAHLTHWGAAEITSDGHRLTSVRPSPDDPEPTPVLENLADAQHHPTRIDRPHLRRGWLENGPGPGPRGDDPFVPVSWETALEALSGELARVYGEYGAGAVYGGSYGWGSAGRFHHAQSQVHRFLNALGGYVQSVHSYSYGASSAILPHVLGTSAEWTMRGSTAWEVIAEHTGLLLAFGGISGKNSQAGPGGVTRHTLRGTLRGARERGCRTVSVSPLRDDTPEEAGAEWLAPAPGTDAALMLALAHVLDAEGLADRAFLSRCTTGYPRFAAYLHGSADGVAKSPEWAAQLTGLDAARIRELAREMARNRTMITVSWSLQRTHHGEQPVWLGVVLAAMLGQIGLPGGGFGHGYGSAADIGRPRRVASAPSLPQHFGAQARGTSAYIPVARIADMLLNPGAAYEFDGRHLRYPEIRLVYWCGGNPFHHHQDLARLRRAFRRPETVVVHDPFWTATARHADIVLPSTMSVERDDFGSGSNDPTMLAMPALTAPHAEARDDYDVFADLSRLLGRGEEFTRGRTSREWLRGLYDDWRARLAADGHPLPDFEAFWTEGQLTIPVPEPGQILLADFRADPERHPLPTPSGRIEIHSETVEGFGYHDCPGHPVWREPAEWLGSPTAVRHPLHLVANQPRTRLHSQLDVGAHSQGSKIQGREPARMHPEDAAARGIEDGALVLLRNGRGRCLAGVRLSEDVRRGVVQLATGAWYDPDPDDPSFCRHGNPNVLTTDRPASTLSQATTGAHALVEAEPWRGPVPELSVLGPPERV